MTAGVDVALAIGVETYSDPRLPDLPLVPGEVAVVRAALLALGFRSPDPLVGSVTARQARRFLTEHAQTARRLVIYWTGHGIAGVGGHWLLTTDSALADPDPTSAMGADELASICDNLTPLQRKMLPCTCTSVRMSELR